MIDKLSEDLSNKNSKEIDSKKIDSKEIDSKEIDSKEIDSKEIDSKEIDSKEIDSKDFKEIDFLIKKIAEEKDRFLRLYAEFENYKKRTQKERFELFKTANKAIIMGLLPILDDFERGIEEIKKYKGMILIQDKLMKLLESEGLKKIKVEKGSDFNTDFHEAITQVPAPKDNLKNKIMDVVESGYLLQEKVIRHAKVVVAK